MSRPLYADGGRTTDREAVEAALDDIKTDLWHWLEDNREMPDLADFADDDARISAAVAMFDALVAEASEDPEHECHDLASDYTRYESMLDDAS